MRSVAAQEHIDELLQGLRPTTRGPRWRCAAAGTVRSWSRTPPSSSVFALARRAADQLGFELRETSVGGASDGNFAAAMGLPVLDGLGAVGGGAHARHEHVTVTGMVERAAVAAAVIAAFGT